MNLKAKCPCHSIGAAFSLVTHNSITTIGEYKLKDVEEIIMWSTSWGNGDCASYELVPKLVYDIDVARLVKYH